MLPKDKKWLPISESRHNLFYAAQKQTLNTPSHSRVFVALTKPKILVNWQSSVPKTL